MHDALLLKLYLKQLAKYFSFIVFQTLIQIRKFEPEYAKYSEQEMGKHPMESKS